MKNQNYLSPLKIMFFATLFSLSIISYSQSPNYFETSKNIEIFTDLYKELDMFYVDEINSGELMKTAIDEMLYSLDPYTTYIPESEMEDHLFMTTGQYGGIGAMISKRDDYIYISEPYEGYPAQKSGLLAGDKILEVNGVSAYGKTTEELSNILKGAPNTEVNIIIERNKGETLNFSFNREKVTIKSVPYYGFIHNDVAYIKLRSFTRNCANQVKKALDELQEKNELKGIILDLRSNPGGLLNESIDIVNLFVEKGVDIVTTKGKIKDWEKTYKTKYTPINTETPLAILINSGSASASEIVSGAIQDLDRGVIIGRRSYGKGLVQQTRRLPYNAQLKVTVAKYYIPSGRCIQALDYSNRNDDGSVGKIPDSLISNFTTKNGRVVKDGGGIYPDVEIMNDDISDITLSLMNKRLIFDFATLFRYNNDTIASAANFEITNDIFNEFKSFLIDKEYDYTTEAEESLKKLKLKLEEENRFEIISEEFNLIEEKIDRNKKNDIERNRKEISVFLASEIVSRYFYQKGRIIERLKDDKDILEAIRLFNNIEDYNNVLNVY